MVELIDIHEYINKIAKIIAAVLDMEVLICDEKLRLLGDSTIERTNPEDFEVISNISILYKAMATKETLIIKNRKQENSGCEVCEKRHSCDVQSIIAFPLFKDNDVIGGIGLYIKEQQSNIPLVDKTKSYIEFISNMGELIISKLEERQENIELNAYYKRMSLIVESIDFALIAIDENYNIISCNTRFNKMFNNKENLSNLEALYKLLNNYELKDFIENNKGVREKQIAFKARSKAINIIVTIDPIMIDKIYKGALIYFKNTTDLYDEINKLTNTQMCISFDEIIGNSKVMIKLKEDTKNFAKSSSTILIQGESGTGKEIFARAIHCESKFQKGAFIAVNCAAIPENLLESELFGHEEGAFTGSMKGGKVGKFELANKGTLFLDEVGDMPLHLQTKLLRAIQDKKIQRIGANSEIEVEIRIIAATNRNLEKMILTGEFREDLYYRLNVIPLYIPAIRERKSDINLLLKYFLEVYIEKLDKNIAGYSKDAENILNNYSWPGNIRELQNAVEYSVNMCKELTIGIKDLPKRILNEENKTEPIVIRPLDEIIDHYIHEALRIYGNDLKGKQMAAAKLGISRATLYRKLNTNNDN